MGIFLPAIEMAGYLCLMPMASLGGTIADNHLKKCIKGRFICE
jgi:hypothetical protein